MSKSAWQYYGVKLVYQMSITGKPIPARVDTYFSDTHTFFEESIVLVYAQSFEHAYTISERKARKNEEVHLNPYGQTVERKLVDAIDCYLVGDEIGNGVEVYSFITPVKKETESNEYLMRTYEYNLDDYDWNTKRGKEKKRLQTVLTYEEFSKWREK
jgi:hypothetical protein